MSLSILWLLPKLFEYPFSASSMVCDKGLPKVSGINNDVTVAKIFFESKFFKNQNAKIIISYLPINDSVPKTVFENQGIVASIPKMSGDKAPPTRAMDEQNPTAEDRTQVGYNSAEYV